MKFKFWYVVIWLIFFSMGLAALTGGCVMLYKNIDLKFHGVYTTALITGAGDDSPGISHRDSNGNYTNRSSFFPILEYNVNGKKIKSQTHSAADNVNVAIGDEVHIIYRPSEPEYVELQSLIRENFIAASVCIVIGLVFTFLTGLIGVRSVKLKRAEQEEELRKQNEFKF